MNTNNKHNRRNHTRSQRILRFVVSLFVWGSAILLYYVGFSFLFDTPHEHKLRKANDKLQQEYEVMAERYDSLEMILDIEIFKNQGPIKEATLVPLVFPLLAGAGSFTTLLSLRAEYAPLNIVIALVLNMIWVYIVLKLTDKVAHMLGKGGIYLLRKFFGIILLAIAARLFTANITLLIDQFQGVC